MDGKKSAVKLNNALMAAPSRLLIGAQRPPRIQLLATTTNIVMSQMGSDFNDRRRLTWEKSSGVTLRITSGDSDYEWRQAAWGTLMLGSLQGTCMR